MKRSVFVGTGFVLAGLLGVLDIIGVAGLFLEPGPPVAVVIAGLLCGLVTLAALIPAWRGSRNGTLAIVITRVLSGLLTVPVFFTGEAPGWARIVGAIAIALTVAGCGLLWPYLRRTS